MEHTNPEIPPATGPETARQDAAGKAYLLVAQSAVLAMQDAVANLRNLQAMANTAIGAALAGMLEATDPARADGARQVLEQAMRTAEGAVQQFGAVSRQVTETLDHLLHDGPRASA